MKLKLNQKGADRIDIEAMEWDPQDYEFDSDDFEDVVMLTFEEAKLAQKLIRNYYFETIDRKVEELIINLDAVLKDQIESIEVRRMING